MLTTMTAPDSRALPSALDPAVSLYVRPLGIAWGPIPDSPEALPFAGGRAWFSWVELAIRDRDTVTRHRVPVAALRRWAAEVGHEHDLRIESFLAAYGESLAPFAGLSLDQPRLMGVVNVTPDSFSDGGDYATAETAIARARELVAGGADLLDIGGESTRPGAGTVPAPEESARVVPVIRALSGECLVSVDTRKSPVISAAVAAGARIVNDVSAATYDEATLAATVKGGAAIVLMHALGDPKTMQVAPSYRDPALDVFDFLESRVAAAVSAGIPRHAIMVDPGVGFGKTLDHNLALLNQLALYKGLGVGVLLGVSRKSFIGRVSGAERPKERLPGSLAVMLHGLDQGADMLRVHDVAESAQAIALWRAVRHV
ncbi:MAG TPA: dihydropteroate synthase [Alphaproteobacteria bacterium]|jgi:dihydropteroate synthase|nr:dihydropteroate synthase [Alphaproteobacteria bacterium]